MLNLYGINGYCIRFSIYSFKVEAAVGSSLWFVKVLNYSKFSTYIVLVEHNKTHECEFLLSCHHIFSMDDFHIIHEGCPDLVFVHQLVELLGWPHDSVGLVLVQLIVTSHIHRNSLQRKRFYSRRNSISSAGEFFLF